jgi:hypothetical protein
MSEVGNGAAGNGSTAAAGAPEADQAVSTAASFIDAVVWGEHNKVWELIGAEGRTEVLEVAVKRGMDEGLAGRLAADAASPSETNEFLADLVNGLRADLAGTDLDTLQYALDPEPAQGGRTRVQLSAPLPAILGEGLPVGSVELSDDGGRWRVEALVPRLGR